MDYINNGSIVEKHFKTAKVNDETTTKWRKKNSGLCLKNLLSLKFYRVIALSPCLSLVSGVGSEFDHEPFNNFRWFHKTFGQLQIKIFQWRVSSLKKFNNYHFFIFKCNLYHLTFLQYDFVKNSLMVLILLLST